MRRKSGNNTAFNDMLFNVLLGFVVLFIIAFLLINPISKKNDIPAKAEFMVLMEWPDMAVSDIDLWVQHEDQLSAVGFNNKDRDGINLERDDLGASNDRIVIEGETTIIRVNREVTNIRGVKPGTYYVNAHSYSWRDNEPIEVQITVIDLNPRYKEVYVMKLMFSGGNQVQKYPAFTVDADGKVTSVFQSNKNIVPIGRSGGGNGP